MVKIKKLFKSFKFSFRGLGHLLRHEQNFRIHTLAAIVVVFLGIYFQIKLWQWSLIVILIAAVLILEMMNTVFERLVDLFKPRLHHYVRDIKDMMSSMVLIASIASVIIALIIFVPYFY